MFIEENESLNKKKTNVWADLYDSIVGVPEVATEFIVDENILKNNSDQIKLRYIISDFSYSTLTFDSKNHFLKHSLSFNEKWIFNSKLFNKNANYKSLNIDLQNSIFNSYEYELFFNDEIKSIKDYFNPEIWNLYNEYHKQFISKHDEVLINLKPYSFNYNYFSPLCRYLSIYFLIHSLSTQNKKYFLLFTENNFEKVNLTELIRHIKILDFNFIENFINCLFMEEGKETSILKDLEKLIDHLELETKKLKFDFENNLNFNEFLKYISPNVNLTTNDINKINDYIFDSITDIYLIINRAIKVVNLKDSFHHFNKYLNIYNLNQKSFELSNSTLQVSKQEKEIKDIKTQLELLNASQIARLLIKLLSDLENNNYYLTITRAKYSRQILNNFNINEDIIFKVEKAIGKDMSNISLKEKTKLTYKIIYNYLKENKLDIKKFCE